MPRGHGTLDLQIQGVNHAFGRVVLTDPTSSDWASRVLARFSYRYAFNATVIWARVNPN
jgi:hypothetical protein